MCDAVSAISTSSATSILNVNSYSDIICPKSTSVLKDEDSEPSQQLCFSPSDVDLSSQIVDFINNAQLIEPGYNLSSISSSKISPLYSEDLGNNCNENDSKDNIDFSNIALTNKLSNIHSLPVASPTTSLSFENSNLNSNGYGYDSSEEAVLEKFDTPNKQELSNHGSYII